MGEEKDQRKWPVAHLVVGRQARVVKCGLRQLDQQVLDLSLAVAQAQQALLQGGQAGDVLGDVQTDQLPVGVQELHHGQAVCKRCAGQNYAGYAGQLW